MSERIMKALANCEQGLTEEQKLQARTNIGAIAGVRVHDTSGTTDLVPDAEGKVTVDLTDAGKVQSDWDETNPVEPSYIQNKPDLSQFATKDELDGKQDVLEAGDNIIIEGNTISATAEPQQQADWAQTDTEAVDYIKNKPTLSAVAESGDYEDLTNKPTIPPAQVQSDWAQTNTSAVDYIKNKPSIPASQVQSDWTEQDTSDPAYIKHKPTLSSVATSGSYDDLSDKPSIPAAQVQSDWSQSNSSAVDYIKNKPSIPAAQVQSDWAQTNTSAVDYIKNKPAPMETKPLVAGTNIEFVSEQDRVIINSVGTKVVKRSDPYTTDVPITEMVVYDPNEDYGALVRDQNDTTVGYFAPKHYGNADEGKVLTVVNENGYKMKWRKPEDTGGLKPLTLSTQPLTSSNPVTLTIADGYAYELVMQDSLGAVVTLATNSETTLHSLIYVKNQGGTHCGTVTIAWRNAALEQHTAELDMTETTYEYCFDVYVRKVQVGNAYYTIATVTDYPVAYRNSLYQFGTDNETTQMVGVWL